MATATQDPLSHPFPLIATPTFALQDGEKPDMFQRVASEMATVHNMMIRGINSVYLQAPYVQPQDTLSFLNYAYCFYDLMSVHHHGEEENIFPAIEEMSGEEGIMERNVQQHHVFHAGLEEYGNYVKACIEGKEKYDAAKLVGIVDSFGSQLTDHLRDEIPTLLALSQYKDRAEIADLEEMFNRESGKHMAKFSLPGTLSWGFFNHDITFEDGLWSEWPPAPGPVKFIVRSVAYWIHRDWWRFAPVDRFGVPKAKLYATADSA